MTRASANAAQLILTGCLVCCSSNSANKAVSDAGDAGEAGSTAGGAAAVRSLFDGVDFTNWNRYLGEPSDAERPLGLDNDPRGVYSVVAVDGEPAIRISGEVWGSLISKAAYCNFDLRAQYKWGSAVWPPLNAIDSGIMFLSTGPLGAVNAGGNALADPAGSGGFMVAMEYQLAPGDTGTLYNLGPIAFSTLSHRLGSELSGAWNQIEIVKQDAVASTRLNGQQVSRVSGFELEWPGQVQTALGCGYLQLQSEGAEVYFRHLEIETLP